jgi:predicted nucleic acid-binding protein
VSAASVDLLIFDTGPLSHFARENWLGVLKAVVGSRTAVIPDVVVAELHVGAARDGRIKAVLDAGWIEHRELLDEHELSAYESFAELLVHKERNRGEAGVLALAMTTGGVAVVDDGAARRAARKQGVTCKPTLSLLCDAVRDGLLTVSLVSALADDLLAGVYRLPFGPGGFEKWATEHGQLG